MRDSRQLDRGVVDAGAKRATQRHARVAVICAFLVGVACATTPTTGLGATIDFEDAEGRMGTLDGSRGRVVIIDLCASWATACNLNARVLDEVQTALKAVKGGARVDVITLLMDEGQMGRVAIESYAATLGVTHPVLLAGPRVRAGTSALGDTGYVPRVVVLNAEGRIVLDDSGGIVNVQGLVKRVTPFLPEQ